MQLEVVGSGAISKTTKALTSSGKLSEKAMSRAAFHNIYQDYVCSCILRVVKETFALLPVNLAVITVLAEVMDSSTGNSRNAPILSAAFDRERFETLNFEQLDPSDTVQGFYHKGEFKKTAKAETFLPIIPLTVEELGLSTPSEEVDSLLSLKKLRSLRLSFDALLQTV
jgi:hypothetical protein